MTRVIPVPILGDNFAYVHRDAGDRAIVVDPGEAPTVLRTLEEGGLSLAAVLLTHAHWDHVGGATELRARTGCEVIGVDRALIPPADRTVADGESLAVDGVTVQVLGTPGHTRASVCYHVLPPGPYEPGVVYTGDTLFVGGCGRLIECDAATMWRSLQRLAVLPTETLVCCGHDYTLENYEFAVNIVPDHRRLRDRLAEVQKAVEYGRLTVPSTIAQERRTNVFLLADDPQVKAALGLPDAEPCEVFAELRRRKDLFG